jgi:glycosyltransferase involved in cell wall biosynthesis
MAKRVAIIGHFGGKENFLDGQTIKTKAIYEELKKIEGLRIKKVDTYYKDHNMLKLLLDFAVAVFTCRRFVLLVAENGMRVMFPIMHFCSKILRKKVYHSVIGASLANRVSTQKHYKKYINSFVVNWCETAGLVEKLKEKGVTNAELLYNFKRLTPVSEKEIELNRDEPYRLCTFSRVMKEKGIEDAIDAVKVINEKYGKTVYSLDIYGQVDAGQQEWFDKIRKESPPYVKYLGQVEYDQSVEVLKKYFALLFPTRYKTEGVPGTIIDAYAAGLPVIASKWENFDNIIDESTGIGYDFESIEALINILDEVQRNPECITDRKKCCLEKYYLFSPDAVVGEMRRKMGI